MFALFSSFIRDLGKTYPEIKNCLYRNYEECLVDTEGKFLDSSPKLVAFLEIVRENEGLISKRDPEFFKIDNILEEISFNNLWNKNISNKTRVTIWKYFQTFSILQINLQANRELKETLESLKSGEDVEIDREMASELRKIKRLSEGIQESTPAEGEGDLEGMLGGMMDSNIGQIAKEVAETMDMESMFGGIGEDTNPMEVMSQMMNPEKMGAIFQNISKVMDGKMESGSLDRDDLRKEAEGMYGKMAQNPLFSGLMGTMNHSSATSAIPQVPAQVSAQSVPAIADDISRAEPEPEISSEERRRLLREKIKQKESVRKGLK